jgi:hypothetical protein
MKIYKSSKNELGNLEKIELRNFIKEEINDSFITFLRKENYNEILSDLK